MKRFYKSVTLDKSSENGFGLLLDGKPVRTPAKQIFIVPNEILANLIVTEWDAQTDEIRPLTMPVSQMTMTLIDRVIPHRATLQDEIFDYIDTDLICYRTDEPEQYKKAQENKWNPFIRWFEDKFHVQLETTTGLSPLTQHTNVHDVIRSTIAGLNDHQFMGVYMATLGTGSIILALAFQSRDFAVQHILEAAFAEEHLKDEIYLGHIYGSAPDQEKKYKSLKADLETLGHFI